MTSIDHSSPRVFPGAKWLFWALAAIVCVLALYPRLTLPEPDATEGLTHSYNHILAYMTLVIVGAVAWGLSRRLIAGLAGYAVALELAQTLSPGRQTTLADMGASLIGVVIGLVLVRAFRRSMTRLSDRVLGSQVEG